MAAAEMGMAAARRRQLSPWRRAYSPACRRLSAAPGRGLTTAAPSTPKGPRAHTFRAPFRVPKGRAWHRHS
eukprot:scaffold78824_cov60-Phaeocystis_antarctica.AAC.1